MKLELLNTLIVPDYRGSFSLSLLGLGTLGQAFYQLSRLLSNFSAVAGIKMVPATQWMWPVFL